MKNCPKCNERHNKPGTFCSRICANSRGPRTDEFKAKVREKLTRNMHLYQCLYCNKDFLRRRMKEDSRKYCSIRCSSLSQRSPDRLKEYEERILNPKTGKYEFISRKCKQCNILFTAKHRDQSYCSIECSISFKKDDVIRRWLEGEIISTSEKLPIPIRRHLFKIHDSKCQNCGWNKVNPVTNVVPLTVNHKDGDGTNHSYENLELICPNCHSLTDSFGNLNRGKSKRVKRYGELKLLRLKVKELTSNQA